MRKENEKIKKEIEDLVRRDAYKFIYENKNKKLIDALAD